MINLMPSTLVLCKDMNVPVYIATKRFTSGFLDGITIQEMTTVEFEEGKQYKSLSGSDYVIEKMELM